MTEFDFIVVGAGPSGCSLAARIAASPAKPSVALLEAGGLNDDAEHLSGPQRFEVAFRENSPLNWGYKTEPQQHGQAVDYSRGKGLGGSTAINFCAWVVGADEDYDEWARMVGDEAFAWGRVRGLLRKVENFHGTVPAGFGEYIQPRGEDHGTWGAVDVSYGEEWLPTTRDVFEAANQVGFGVNPDVNSGNPMGMGIGSCCVYKDVRVTASSAYLASRPPNLTVIPNAHVARILLYGKTATGVQTVDGREFRATKEVVVSGGAINSPQVLLLSGIGPADDLQKHGIEVVHELPQVGRNLRDHCFSVAGILVKKDHDKSFAQSPSPMGWLKIPAVLGSREFEELPPDVKRYLRKPHVPSWELATHAPFIRDVEVQAEEEIFSAICLTMNPQSRGTVTLRSSNPTDAPVIDPNFLTHPFDRKLAIESMREMLRFFQAPVWKEKTIRNLWWPRDDSDEAILEAYWSKLHSSWHMCGTVQMGLDADEACVDSSFCVIGLKHLRVVDMSVCPLIPNNHTQTTAYLIGEIAAEKLIAEYLLDIRTYV